MRCYTKTEEIFNAMNAIAAEADKKLASSEPVAWERLCQVQPMSKITKSAAVFAR